MKELIMLTGLIVLYLTAVQVKIIPTVPGKLTTFFQMVTIVLLLAAGMGLRHEGLLLFAFITTSILIFISTTGYIITGIKAFREAH